ncbi:MAG TPA: phosphate ABC transporter substrate-binding protein [Ktedonobacteraceae bacterium]|nr:phosphate ABC transporter substrate-binding protein [Ktedonobacteraceae bacterium]
MNTSFHHTLLYLKRAARPVPVICLMLAIFCLFTACEASFGSSSAPLSGHIRIDGSTALQPLVSKAATLFHNKYPQVQIQVDGGGSVTGLNDVTTHKVDIGNSDIYADPATYPDPNLTDHLVCVIPFTMIVSSDVPVADLKVSQIIDIFATGKITNWSQLGGPDLQIVPIVRPPTSGTRATFRRYVLGGRDERGNLLAINSSQDVVKTVASTPGAIGYLAASVLDSHVHAISIGGYSAAQKNIEDGHYTFWSYEHMYTLSVESAGPVDAFLNFMLTPQVQQEATALHYIPVSALKFQQLSKVPPVAVPYALYFPEKRKRSIL